MGNLLKRENLKNVNPKLVGIVEEAVNRLPFDVFVVEGMRTKRRQLELVAQGRSRTKTSKHMIGKAVDLAPYRDGKILWGEADKPLFKAIRDKMILVAREKNIRIRSGSDWDMNGVTDEEELSAYKAKFGRFPLVDYPHYELV